MYIEVFMVSFLNLFFFLVCNLYFCGKKKQEKERKKYIEIIIFSFVKLYVLFQSLPFNKAQCQWQILTAIAIKYAKKEII